MFHSVYPGKYPRGQLSNNLGRQIIYRPSHRRKPVPRIVIRKFDRELQDASHESCTRASYPNPASH